MKAKTFFDVDKPSEKLNISNGTLPGINEEASDGEGDNTGFLTAVSSAVKFRKLRKRHLKNNPSIRRFERRYTELGRYYYSDIILILFKSFDQTRKMKNKGDVMIRIPFGAMHLKIKKDYI